MTTKVATSSKAAASSKNRVRIIDVRPKNGEAKTTVAFGSVVIEAYGQETAEIKRNVEAGQLSLARAKGKILRPGVKIQVPKNVPIFHADPSHPGKIVRELNGKRQSGMFIEGKFKAG